MKDAGGGALKTPTPTLPPPLLKKMTRYYSAPLPTCFRPSSSSSPAAIDYHHAPPSTTTNPNITTCLYDTHLGLFSLTWSRSLLSRSLHLCLSSPTTTTSLHLSLRPFLFWNKQGIKKLALSPSSAIWVFWDLSNARFGPGPEPESGFYIAVLSEGEMILFVGDLEREAYAKTRALRRSKNGGKAQPLVLRREHVVAKNKFYSTRIDLGGKSRLISIELNESCEEDPRLVIRFDQKRVVQVKHLKWKFRGSERIEVDGHPIQLSWDVYNWLFDSKDANQDDGYALFTFRFEKQGNEYQNHEIEIDGIGREKGVVTWSQDSCGLNYERKKMKKRLLMKTRSPSFSSSSLSSASSGCSSVLEWESVEENELKGPTGFSLLIYAWKS